MSCPRTAFRSDLQSFRIKRVGQQQRVLCVKHQSTLSSIHPARRLGPHQTPGEEEKEDLRIQLRPSSIKREVRPGRQDYHGETDLLAAQRAWRRPDDFSYSQFGHYTGFPVPIGYSNPGRGRLRDPLNTAEGAGSLWDISEEEEEDVGQEDKEENEPGKKFAELRPVFRRTPFTAEEQRQARGTDTARILFVDEGNCCRSVLAEAMFKKVIAGSPLEALVSVESASVGPAEPGAHDPRVQRLAREAGLPLGPRCARVFDEILDIVNFDLVLAMDKFDHEEVMREVAVLDTINPGGYYSARLRQLGQFALASPAFEPKRAQLQWALNEGIADPLYGNQGGMEEESALWATLRKLRLACGGLMQYLLHLQPRCVAGTTFQGALAQALKCPLLGPEAADGQKVMWAAPVKEKGASWRPVWRKDTTQDGEDREFYTLRKVHGKRYIVRRAGPRRVRRGFWRSRENVEEELRRWVKEHGEPGLMPTLQNLRKSGANTLCTAIQNNGGFNSFAESIGVKATRRPKGYWDDIANLKQELLDFNASQKAQNSAWHPQGACEGIPAQNELRMAGRFDLGAAIQKWGGVAAVCKLTGLPRASTTRVALEDVGKELEAAVPSIVQSGRMPTRAELAANGHSTLADNVQALGGFRRVATSLGLSYASRRAPASKPSTAKVAAGARQPVPPPILRSAARETILDSPLPVNGFAPAQASGGGSLSSSIGEGSGPSSGGASSDCQEEADELLVHQWASLQPGAGFQEDTAKSGWRGEEIRLSEGRQKHARLPGMAATGSVAAVSQKGAERPTISPNTSIGREALPYLQSPADAARSPLVESEVQDAAAAEVGQQGQLESEVLLAVGHMVVQLAHKNCGGKMPTILQLEAAGGKELVRNVAKYGGVRRLACFLGLEFQETRGRKREAVAPSRERQVVEAYHAGYPELMPEVGQEVLQLAHRTCGGRMPTKVQLEAAGGKELVRGVARCGGIRRLARVLGLEMTRERRTRAFV